MRIFWLGLLVLVSLSLFAKAEADPSYARPAAQLYRRYCVSCHGTDGKSKTSKGKYSHARDLTEAEWQADVSDERIFNSISRGKGKMPAFKKLSDAQIDSLVTYVRRLRK